MPAAISPLSTNTVKPSVLSGHPRGKLQCPLNTGCLPKKGFNR